MIMIVLINSPCQYRRKFSLKSMEHVNTNFGLYRVKGPFESCFKLLLLFLVKSE